VFLLPIVLILMALLSAAAFAYGTNANLAQYSHGLQLILLARQWQWLLFVLALLFCLALFALVVSGKRRIYWLLALAPVLALFYHKFRSDPMNAFIILDDPPFVSSADATFLSDNDWIVGLKFNEQAYAYPYSTLYITPVIVQNDRDKRMVLIWSAFANRARATQVDRDVKASDLEIVSYPANSLLLYNARFGQFINGVPLTTPDGKKPTGFTSSITPTKTTWKIWRTMNPGTKVLGVRPQYANLPAGPIWPNYPMPKSAEVDAAPILRIAMIESPSPLAIREDAIPQRPLNVSAGDTPILLVRDRTTGLLRAFDRHVEDDLYPQFKANLDPNRPSVALIDVDTLTGWSTNGAAVDGDPKYKSKKLSPIPVDDQVYWGVMKFWYPQLKLHPRTPDQPEPTAYEAPSTDDHASSPRGNRRRPIRIH